MNMMIGMIRPLRNWALEAASNSRSLRSWNCASDVAWWP